MKPMEEYNMQYETHLVSEERSKIAGRVWSRRGRKPLSPNPKLQKIVKPPYARSFVENSSKNCQQYSCKLMEAICFTIQTFIKLFHIKSSEFSFVSVSHKPILQHLFNFFWVIIFLLDRLFFFCYKPDALQAITLQRKETSVVVLVLIFFCQKKIWNLRRELKMYWLRVCDSNRGLFWMCIANYSCGFSRSNSLHIVSKEILFSLLWKRKG